ncbi:hypothetical protein ACJX0J_035033, partial [Zea mays]
RALFFYVSHHLVVFLPNTSLYNLLMLRIFLLTNPGEAPTISVIKEDHNDSILSSHARLTCKTTLNLGVLASIHIGDMNVPVSRMQILSHFLWETVFLEFASDPTQLLCAKYQAFAPHKTISMRNNDKYCNMNGSSNAIWNTTTLHLITSPLVEQVQPSLYKQLIFSN